MDFDRSSLGLSSFFQIFGQNTQNTLGPNQGYTNRGQRRQLAKLGKWNEKKKKEGENPGAWSRLPQAACPVALSLSLNSRSAADAARPPPSRHDDPRACGFRQVYNENWQSNSRSISRSWKASDSVCSELFKNQKKSFFLFVSPEKRKEREQLWAGRPGEALARLVSHVFLGKSFPLRFSAEEAATQHAAAMASLRLQLANERDQALRQRAATTSQRS